MRYVNEEAFGSAVEAVAIACATCTDAAGLRLASTSTYQLLQVRNAVLGIITALTGDAVLLAEGTTQIDLSKLYQDL